MRRWLVLISAALHLVLVFGLFVAGFWKLEQLDRPRISVALSAPLPPPPAPAGGASPTTAPTFTHKPKPVTHEMTQPEPKHDETPKPLETTTTGGEGSGAGSGNGSGDPTSTSTCTENCGPGDGSGSAQPEKKKEIIHHDDVAVPPDVIRGMRISGDTQIHPADVDKTAIARDGKDKVIAVFKTCVNELGGVASVKMLKSSGYASYDRALSDAMYGWRYNPYKIGGEAVTACGIVTFIYQVR